MLYEPAMTREQAAKAVLTGIHIVEKLAGQGYDLLATGEMGIGIRLQAARWLPFCWGVKLKK